MSSESKMSYEKRVWRDLKRRCLMPNTPSYIYYGAKGIKISDEWVSSFDQFLLDMGRRPDEGYMLGRLDKQGDFSKENCRWMTRKEINENKSNCLLNWDMVNAARRLYKETSMTMDEIAKELGLDNKDQIVGAITGASWKDANYTYEKRLPKGNIDPYYHKMREKYSEFGMWQAMVNRCRCKTYSNYNLYGGRGIKVCDRWKDSFYNFIEDMGRRPGKGYQIDRIDTNGDYCPENCRWVTAKENSRNKRNNVITQEIANQIKSLRAEGMKCREISEALGVGVHVVMDVSSGRRWA